MVTVSFFGRCKKARRRPARIAQGEIAEAAKYGRVFELTLISAQQRVVRKRNDVVENASNEYLDDVILSRASYRQLKVAMLHVRVWDKCNAEECTVSNEKFNERLRHLIDSGELRAFGDITNWQFSEVVRTRDTTNVEPAE